MALTRKTMLDQASKYAAMSVCNKRKVGCVVVKDNAIISYGFNHGFSEACECSPCDKNPHVLHAEQMALCGSDKEIYNGADIYVTYPPCEKCMILIEKCKLKTLTYVDKDGEVRCKSMI